MKDKPKYFTLDEIKKKKALYNVIFGIRSNGKTYSVLMEALHNYADSNMINQTAMMRRYLDDIMPSKMSTIFNGIIKNGEIEKIFKNKGGWTYVRYYMRKFFLAKKVTRTLTNGKEIEEEVFDEKPFMYVFAITEEEDYKQNSFPYVNLIIYDEFIARTGYVKGEFIMFMNLLSTIKRDRMDVTIYLIGNSISYTCPYFIEMGLKHIRQMKQGDIDLYTYGDTDLKVAVQYAEPAKKIKSRRDIDPYFAFDNPRLKMITTGDFELDLHPHCPYDYRPMDIKYYFFIIFESMTYQCEIVYFSKQWFIFIHRKSTPIQNPNKDRIYQAETDVRWNYHKSLTRALSIDSVGQSIALMFANNKVFYQDNQVGEDIRNYIEQNG